MRTTIEINEQLLREAMAVTGIKKKRQCIELALREVIRQERIKRLIQRLGKMPLTIDTDDLDRMRADD